MARAKIKILNCEQVTEKDQYPVFRITYDTTEDDELTEDLPMVEFAPDEDRPGFWLVNEKRLTPFQEELYSAFHDWCADQAEKHTERMMDR